MKKYIKPELEISLIESASNVAAENVSTTFVGKSYTNDVGSVGYEELF